MIYSSGTSGRPKGIMRPLTRERFGALTAGDQMLRKLYGFDEHTALLCPAPLYHAAPLSFAMSVQRAGGRVVLMSRFDAGDALDAIEREKATAVWLVPTMMTRLLRLPENRRKAADISRLTHVIHSAAPFPVEVKQAMMDWWGPVLYEFYSSTEANGMTAITPQEWLQHPGSVGRSEDVRIVDEAGAVLDHYQVGVVYFAKSWLPFEYHNDPEKTAATIDQRGWTTIGDMGYLDNEGYLYLTDRKSHMIISGGVNIYPQEAESILSLHDMVQDVAVIGVPNADYGEEVKAVVQLIDFAAASPSLAAELIDYCQARLAKYKCPRSVDFIEDFPRLPTGKLLKRLIRERYWPSAERMI
jgi:long-chain acyl-CoA synthetase